MFKLTLEKCVPWKLQNADMYVKHNTFQMAHLSQLWVSFLQSESKMCMYKTQGVFTHGGMGGDPTELHIANSKKCRSLKFYTQNTYLASKDV